MKRSHCVGLLVLLSACGDSDPSDAPEDAAIEEGPIDAAVEEPVDAAQDTMRDTGQNPEDAGRAADAEPGDSAADMDAVDAGSLTAADWILAHFSDADVVQGESRNRQRIETPVLVHEASACCAKYAFDLVERAAPVLPEAGFVNVRVRALESSDAFGAAIQTSNAEGATVYIAGMEVDPGWPRWQNYATTNYDGLVLDGAENLYAEDLTIRNWNADGAIDNKANISQFVRLRIEGNGHRAIRFWRPGPHYLVDSSIRNEGEYGEGSLLWFRRCDEAEVRVYGSTFNGADRLSPEQIRCDGGSSPTIEYLDVDPRTTGEMHEMFSP